MIEFYRWLIHSGNNVELRNFRAGYVIGAFVVIALLIIIKILHYFLFKRKKKVSEICIPAEGGSLFVSAGALIDLVKIVAADFDYIEVLKVAVWETKIGITMKINVKYDIFGKQYPELSQDLQKVIQENLKGRLGIDSIRYIEVNTRKITDNKNSKF